MRAQAEGILACDFFHAETISLARLYCFAVVEHATRRVYVLGVTANPRAGWVAQQGRNLLMELGERAGSFKFMIRDRDGKFTALFDEVFRAEGIRIVRTAAQAPRMNAIMERRVELIDWSADYDEDPLGMALNLPVDMAYERVSSPSRSAGA